MISDYSIRGDCWGGYIDDAVFILMIFNCIVIDDIWWSFGILDDDLPMRYSMILPFFYHYGMCCRYLYWSFDVYLIPRCDSAGPIPLDAVLVDLLATVFITFSVIPFITCLIPFFSLFCITDDTFDADGALSSFVLHDVHYTTVRPVVLRCIVRTGCYRRYIDADSCIFSPVTGRVFIVRCHLLTILYYWRILFRHCIASLIFNINYWLLCQYYSDTIIEKVFYSIREKMSVYLTIFYCNDMTNEMIIYCVIQRLLIAIVCHWWWLNDIALLMHYSVPFLVMTLTVDLMSLFSVWGADTIDDSMTCGTILRSIVMECIILICSIRWLFDWPVQYCSITDSVCSDDLSDDEETSYLAWPDLTSLCPLWLQYWHYSQCHFITFPCCFGWRLWHYDPSMLLTISAIVQWLLSLVTLAVVLCVCWADDFHCCICVLLCLQIVCSDVLFCLFPCMFYYASISILK